MDPNVPMQSKTMEHAPPPMYSNDILAPPTWNGPPGQLIPWFSNGPLVTPRFSIFGTDSQVLQVLLHPGQSVTCQPGAMSYKGGDGSLIKLNTNSGGCMAGLKRCCGGESFFRNVYTNVSNAPVSMGLSPDFPAKIVPLDLGRSGAIYAAPGLYLGHLDDVKVSFKFVKNLAAGCCGGSGFFLLKLTGTGTVFINGGGTVMEKQLAANESILLDTNSMIGFAGTGNYEVKCNGGCMEWCCSGEGCFNTMITGPGIVMVQSMSKQRLIKALAPPQQAAAAGAAGGAAAGGAGGGGGQ